MGLAFFKAGGIVEAHTRRAAAVAALFVPLLVMAVPSSASAQGILSFGVGAGVGVGDEDAGGSDGSHFHGLGYLQLKPPLFPVGARGDLILIEGGGEGGPIAVALSAVGNLPLPLITPYALAGWGTYGVAEDDAQGGWNLGFGVRVALPGLGLFAEGRKHQRFDRNVITIGLTF